jgi:hypothetical protein
MPHGASRRPEHRVGRVIFDVGVRAAEELRGFGSTLYDEFDALIVPALESALDDIDDAGWTMRFDRVELNLGTIRRDMDARSVADLIRRDMPAALRDAMRGGDATGAARDDLAEFAHFIATGQLPWVEPGRALESLARTLAALDAAGIRRLAEFLRPTLIRRQAAARLARQVPAALVRRLLRSLLPSDAAAAVTAAFGADSASVIGDVIPSALANPASTMIRTLAIGDAPPPLGDVFALYASLLDRRAVPVSPIEPTNSLARAESVSQAARPAKESAVERTLPVHAAGAVLLHPFLPRLFAAVDLLNNAGGFRDENARARAVLLTYFVATGQEDAPEPETVLFKLLCGMDLADSLPRRLNSTESERGEAVSLLQGVVTHWSRLGHTSPDGLRDGFLLRAGQLSGVRENRRLTIEKRGIDVLLDSLPWGLSSVKTPFMTSPLTVVWR